MTVTVWARPGCGPCLAVKAALDAHNVPYVLRALADATSAQVGAWRALGALSAPVVEWSGETFGGFIPHKVQAVIDAR